MVPSASAVRLSLAFFAVEAMSVLYLQVYPDVHLWLGAFVVASANQSMPHQLSPATAANAFRFDEQELYLASGGQPAQP